MENFIIAVVGAPWHILNASERASWIQAIGSIVAITAAFLIPYVQHRKERAVEAIRRKEEQLLADLLAAKNLATVVDQSLYAAHALVSHSQHAESLWATPGYLERIEKLSGVLESLIAPDADPVAVTAALDVSLALTRIAADFRMAQGSITPEIYARCDDHIAGVRPCQESLQRLERKLIEECTALKLPISQNLYRS